MPITRWGILGTGAIASHFAEGLRFVPGAELRGVASRTAGNAERFVRDYGAGRAFSSYQALVASSDVDVVYVATPSTDHRASCLLALEAGKPVLCEKPFALDASAAREVVALARRKQLFCMEAMWTRFAPIWSEVRARLDRGALGQVRRARLELGFPYAREPGQRLFDPQQGGGALLDLGVYPLSLARWLFGKPAGITGKLSPGPSGVDEEVSAILSYADGRQVFVGASLTSALSNQVEIHGTEASLRVDAPLYFPERATLRRTGKVPPMRPATRSKLGALKKHPVAQRLKWGLQLLQEETVTRRAAGNGYNLEAAEVMRCLAEGKLESPTMPLDETIDVLELVDALR